MGSRAAKKRPRRPRTSQRAPQGPPDPPRTSPNAPQEGPRSSSLFGPCYVRTQACHYSFLFISPASSPTMCACVFVCIPSYMAPMVVCLTANKAKSRSCRKCSTTVHSDKPRRFKIRCHPHVLQRAWVRKCLLPVASLRYNERGVCETFHAVYRRSLGQNSEVHP